MASPWRSSSFLQDRVLQRFVEQNFEPLCVVLVEVWRGSVGAVLRRDQVRSLCLTWKPGHYFHELLFLLTFALVFIRQSTEAFGRISCGGHRTLFFETGDCASEVSQNFGMSSGEQNLDEFIVRVKQFSRRWDVGSQPAIT